MKRFYLLSMVIGYLLVACNEKASDEIVPPGESQNPANLEVLSFSSIEEMQSTVYGLMSMDATSLDMWYAENGNFESQEKFMWAVNNELDNAKSMDEIIAIQDRYSNLLLFNNNSADNDMSPYIPSNEIGYSLVCNRNGDVKINGTITNFNTLTSFEETDFYKLFNTASTRGVSESPNFLYSEISDRKFWAETRILAGSNPGIIGILLAGKKKGLFGWTKYKTAFHIRLRNLTDDRTYVPRYGWYAYEVFFADNVLSNSAGAWTNDLAFDTFLPVGKVQFNSSTGKLKDARMQLMIFSRGTDVKGQGHLDIHTSKMY